MAVKVMSRPAKILGTFTAYPRWFRTLFPVLGLAELRVLIAIIEGTSGWNRNSVSYSQRKLAHVSGLDRMNAIKGLRVLVDVGVVAHCTQGKVATYSLRDLGPEEGWSQFATKAAESIQRWSRKATRGGSTTLPRGPKKPTTSKGSSERRDTNTRNKIREKNLRGASRRTTYFPEEIADVNWAVAAWKEAHRVEPKWAKGSYVTLYAARRRVNADFRAAWSRFLKDRAEWLQGHPPELFSKHLNRWRVPAASATSDRAGSVYRIDEEA